MTKFTYSTEHSHHVTIELNPYNDELDSGMQRDLFRELKDRLPGMCLERSMLNYGGLRNCNYGGRTAPARFYVNMIGMEPLARAFTLIKIEEAGITLREGKNNGKDIQDTL